MEKSVKIVTRTVSMYLDEWEVVEWVMKQKGLRKYSAALRHIINDYRCRHISGISPTNQQSNNDGGTK